MNCKKCGNVMPDGARFCISCGAEHDSNGQLVANNNQVDYNKTIMINDISKGSGVDYNKTVMANDFQQSRKVDYNKTMMANDLPQGNKIDYNKTMMANDLPQGNASSAKSFNPNVNKANKKQKKKSSPILLIVFFIVILVVVINVISKSRKKKVENVVSETTMQVETTVQAAENGNVVSDFDSTDGYWSNDAEFFYRNGTMQTNQWIGDYYVGSDGRKVKNKLIDDTYYVDASGKKVKNEWYKFKKKVANQEVTVWYYLGPDGAKLTDTLSPDGYYVDKDGIYIPGADVKSGDSRNYVPKQ